MRNGYRERENMIFTNLNDDLQNKSLAKKIYEFIKPGEINGKYGEIK